MGRCESFQSLTASYTKEEINKAIRPIALEPKYSKQTYSVHFNAEWITNKTGATNINENSIGSVTPAIKGSHHCWDQNKLWPWLYSLVYAFWYIVDRAPKQANILKFLVHPQMTLCEKEHLLPNPQFLQSKCDEAPSKTWPPTSATPLQVMYREMAYRSDDGVQLESIIFLASHTKEDAEVSCFLEYEESPTWPSIPVWITGHTIRRQRWPTNDETGIKMINTKRAPPIPERRYWMWLFDETIMNQCNNNSYKMDS